MSDPFYGEIRMFAGNFAPLHWALCDGQLMNISDNNTLFTLLGTTYGGDGATTFALPDLRGRFPVHQGQAPNLSNYTMGQKFGAETVTLTIDETPSHTHPMQASTATATDSSPSPAKVLAAAVSPNLIYAPTTDAKKISKLVSSAVLATGGNQPHGNLMPALCISFIICLLGFYPDHGRQ